MPPYQNKRTCHGFTLIELLVVMAIIAILSGIALPKFSAYRQRAYDIRALSDLRNIAAAEEVYFLDNERYLSCQNSECAALPGIFRLSTGVSITITGDQEKFTGESKHANGSGKRFIWNSENGGLLE